MSKYPRLFSTYTIRNTTFRNRIFCSPSLTTWPDYTGAPNEAYLYDVIDKARGGAAVITLGETNVNRSHSRRGCETFLSHSDGYPLERVNNSPTNAYAKISSAVIRHGARLSIEELPVVARCNDCDTQWTISGLSFRCEKCQSGSIEIISGRELDIQSIEIAEGENHVS